MRRVLTIALVVSLVLGGIVQATVQASTAVRLYIDEVEVHPDQPAFMDGAFIMVPLRAAAEMLGYTVSYQDSTRAVTLVSSNEVIGLSVGSEIVNKNGQQVTVARPLEVHGGRSFIWVNDAPAIFGGVGLEWSDTEQWVRIKRVATYPYPEKVWEALRRLCDLGILHCRPL